MTRSEVQALEQIARMRGIDVEEARGLFPRLVARIEAAKAAKA